MQSLLVGNHVADLDNEVWTPRNSSTSLSWSTQSLQSHIFRISALGFCGCLQWWHRNCMQKCFEAISRSSSRHASRTAVWLWLSAVEKLGPVQPLLKVKIMFRNGRWFSCKSWKQPADPDDVLKTACLSGLRATPASALLPLNFAAEEPVHSCRFLVQHHQMNCATVGIAKV